VIERVISLVRVRVRVRVYVLKLCGSVCGCDFCQSWFEGFASVCGFAGTVSDARFMVGRLRFQGREGKVSRSGGSGFRSGGSGSGFGI
jgi:hypothetical protein